MLYQNDDYGKDYLLGLRSALGKNYADANIAAEVPFEVTATQPRVADDADPGERRDDLRAPRDADADHSRVRDRSRRSASTRSRST